MTEICFAFFTGKVMYMYMAATVGQKLVKWKTFLIH